MASITSQIGILERRIKELEASRKQIDIAIKSDVTLTVVELPGVFFRAEDIEHQLEERHNKITLELAALKRKSAKISEILS